MREDLVSSCSDPGRRCREPENGVLSILLVHEPALRKCYSSRIGS